MTTNSSLIGLDPTTSKSCGLQNRRPAPRPSSLAGARVGLVVNGLGHADRFFEVLWEKLKEVEPVSEAILVRKADISVGPSQADFERLTANATVAITGFGGCGSCSTRSARDAMELEWAGVPSVALIHEAVIGGVQTLVRLSGMPDYRYALIGQPYHNLCAWTESEMREAAQILVPQIVTLLTDRCVSAAAAA
jgi:hypothetical protein